MRVCLIVAVANPGCTSRIREAFVTRLMKAMPDAELQQFVLPRDGPPYCLGCKQCFIKDPGACPHVEVIDPIWRALSTSDLAVFITPTYVFGLPAQLKALLDHLGGRWLVHKPSAEMLDKRALILCQAAGAGLRGAVSQLKHSLQFLGVGHVRTVKVRLMDTAWPMVPDRVKARLDDRMEREIARAARSTRPAASLKTRAMYRGMALGQKMLHRMLTKKGQPPTSDYLYWQQQGWLDGHFPWQKPSAT